MDIPQTLIDEAVSDEVRLGDVYKIEFIELYKVQSSKRKEY